MLLHKKNISLKILRKAPRFDFHLLSNGRDTCISTKIKIKALDASTKKKKYTFKLKNSCDENQNNFEITPNNYFFDIQPFGVLTNEETIKPDSNYIFKLEIGPGSLEFKYFNDNLSLVNNKVIIAQKNASYALLQKCSEKIYLNEGDYHAEINTRPSIKMQFKIYAGQNKIIGLPKPGFLKINKIALNKVAELVWVYNNISTRTVMLLNPSENNVSQPIELQPGNYRIQVPTAIGSKTISEFIIKSSETTEIDLL